MRCDCLTCYLAGAWSAVAVAVAGLSFGFALSLVISWWRRRGGPTQLTSHGGSASRQEYDRSREI
jgi:hypothetical protein